MCVPRTNQETGNPAAYPSVPYCEQDIRPMVMPKAPAYACQGANQRPVNMGYTFQLRLVIHGFCRLREVRVFAFPVERQHYKGILC